MSEHKTNEQTQRALSRKKVAAGWQFRREFISYPTNKVARKDRSRM